METFIAVICCGIVIFAFIYVIFTFIITHMDFKHVPYDRKLQKDAQIINVFTYPDGDGRMQRYVTKVTFDDGFTFSSHKGSKRVEGFLSYTISMSREAEMEIVRRAIKEHEAAYRQQNGLD